MREGDCGSIRSDRSGRSESLSGAGAPGGPPRGAGPGPGAAGDDTVTTIFPYRNAQALIAYYLGIFSFIPCLGLPLSIAALILGIRGLGAVRRNPQAKGAVHAWVGLIGAGVGLLINVPILALIVVGLLSEIR